MSETWNQIVVSESEDEAFSMTRDLHRNFAEQSMQKSERSSNRALLNGLRGERPNPKQHYKVGIYIRYFNQTKYADYLDYHVKQYQDTMALCPNWELIDFYIDEGATAPNMESAPEWCRLLQDCFRGNVNLIITQKVSNVSKKDYEITFLARILAALEKPVGIYFVSEDIFTMASCYQDMLNRVLRLCAGTWEGDANSFSANILNGITRLVFAFGDQLNDEIFKEKVGALSIKQLVRMSKERCPGSMGYAEAMLLEYNGKKKNLAQRLSMNKLHVQGTVGLCSLLSDIDTSASVPVSENMSG